MEVDDTKKQPSRLRYAGCALLLLLALLCTPFAVSAAPVYHWYCHRQKDHSPPPLDAQLRVIESYSAYYRNPAAENEKVIYLTFDAGYENGNVARVLDTLHEHHATGAFFILSHLVESQPELVRRMTEYGCLVCNHTAHHPDLSGADDETFRAELQGLEDVYRAATGAEIARFYRPPQGTFSERNLKQAQDLGYTTVFWSEAYADWDNHHQPDPKASLAHLIAHLHNGEILLLHPTSKTNADILGEFLTQAEALGYRFGSLEELCRKEN